MEKTNKSFKEWNAIVEALGQGLQTIIIRKNHTTANGFLLYPTFSYALKDDYLNNFKDEFRPFVENNTLPKKDNDKIEIKYYAKVQNIVEKSPKQISSLTKYHIWDNKHVKTYLNGKNGFIWLLRIYKLNKPHMANFNRGMRFANLKKNIEVSDENPIIDEKKFSDIIKKIS